MRFVFGTCEHYVVNIVEIYFKNVYNFAKNQYYYFLIFTFNTSGIKDSKYKQNCFIYYYLVYEN